MKLNRMIKGIIGAAALGAAILLSSCAGTSDRIDPGDWGYDCQVKYDSLGGVINSREVRTTYYLENSYIFEPSGTSNMLVKPVKDGYILAGWYTAKADGAEQGVYSFDAKDRWDFDYNRVSDDITLYARWIPQATVDYVNAENGEVIFSKNVTVESPVQELSNAILGSRTPEGYVFAGYYTDPSCTAKYDFSSERFYPLLPEEQDVYAQLFEEFPEYINKVELSEEDDEEIEENRWLFLNELGYDIVTEDEEQIELIFARKSEIYEEYITRYEAVEKKTVYIKFNQKDGKTTVTGVDSLKLEGGGYGFTSDGIYVLESDLDLSGVTLTLPEEFTGSIIGQGHSIKNITLNISNFTKVTVKDSHAYAGLFASVKGASFEDVTFENVSLVISDKTNNSLTVGILAGKAEDTAVKNVTFKNCDIISGSLDEASTLALGEDRVIVAGQIFGEYGGAGGSFEGVSHEECDINILVEHEQSFMLATENE